MLDLKAKALPHQILPANLTKDNTDPNKIDLGESLQGRVQWDVEINPHLFITTTGVNHGHNIVYANLIRHCLEHENKWDMAFFDLMTTEISSHQLTAADQRKYTANKMQTAYELSEKLVKQLDAGTIPTKNTLVIIDWVKLFTIKPGLNITEEDQDKMVTNFQTLLKYGQEVGIHMVIHKDGVEDDTFNEEQQQIRNDILISDPTISPLGKAIMKIGDDDLIEYQSYWVDVTPKKA